MTKNCHSTNFFFGYLLIYLDVDLALHPAVANHSGVFPRILADWLPPKICQD